MLNAEAARIITRSVQLRKQHAGTIELIMDRINGAACAGLTEAIVEIGGNQLTVRDAQQIVEVIQGGEFAVAHEHVESRGFHRFKISWA